MGKFYKEERDSKNGYMDTWDSKNGCMDIWDSKNGYMDVAVIPVFWNVQNV